MADSGVFCCEGSIISCCDQQNKDTSTTPIPMSVTIDGQRVEVAPSDKNIVDIATRAKIGIPAACYRAQRKKGCCHGCVVEIDGEQKFACVTAPRNGMNIVLDRADLKAIRQHNLKKYKEGIKSGNLCKCSVSCSSDCCG